MTTYAHQSGAELLTDQDYSECLATAHLLALQLEQLPLEEMLEKISLAHAVGPIVDPTLYKAKGQVMWEDEQVLEALARAKSRILELRRRVAARKGASE